MSKTASSTSNTPVNYAQAASKARSGASTPANSTGSAATQSRQLAPAVNGQSPAAPNANAGSGDRDAVSVSRPPVGVAVAASINFGSLNDGQAILSSSPAAPSNTGAHLQPGGKPTFGSISSSDVSLGISAATSVEERTNTKLASIPITVSQSGGAPATTLKKPDFNSFFQGGGAGSTSTSSAGSSAPISAASSVAPSTSSSAAHTPAFPPVGLPAGPSDASAHQRRQSTTYEASVSSSTSSPRPPSAVSSSTTYTQQGGFPQSGLPGASRPFSPAGSPFPQQNMVFMPQGMYGHQKTPSGGFAAPAQYSNGAGRPAFIAAPPTSTGARPGQQRFNSSQTPTSPRMPTASLPTSAAQYPYSGFAPWQVQYANGQYGFIPTLGYPTANHSAFLGAQQQQQQQLQQQQQQQYQQHQQAHHASQSSSAASVNGSITTPTNRASSASPAPSALSLSTAATPAPSVAAAPAQSLAKPNAAAPEFNMIRDFKQTSTKSRAIEIRKPPSKAIEIKKPPAAAKVDVQPSQAAEPVVEGATVSKPEQSAEIFDTKAIQEVAPHVGEVEKERLAKLEANAKTATAAKLKPQVDEIEALDTESARLEKLRLDEASEHSEKEHKAEQEVSDRDRVAVETAKSAPEAAKVEAPVMPEHHATALVDASAPPPKTADMPAIMDAEAREELTAEPETPTASTSKTAFRALHRPILDEERDHSTPEASEVPSSPASLAPSRATTPPTTLEIPSKPAGPLPLANAKPLRSLGDVTYPEGFTGPKAELNVAASDGLFRYDRIFLLQFQNLCQDRPEGMPDAETLGMQEHESSYNTPTTPKSATGRYGRTGGSMPPPPMRQPSMGAPGRGMQAMGAFGTIPKTSEARFQAATAQMGMGGFGKGGLGGRTPSQQMGSRSGSKRGSNRNASARGPAPATVQYGLDGQPVAPLQKTENAWSDNINKARAGGKPDDTSPEMVQRKVKALLNKLTVDNFPSISKQILVWADKSVAETDGRILRQVIQLIFEKATDEAAWSTMYARLCRMLQDTVSESVGDQNLKDSSGQPVHGGTLFRKYLLNRCQEDYERGWANRDTMTAAAASKAAEDEAKRAANEKAETDAAQIDAKSSAEPKEAEILSEEYYAAQKAKRQGLGLVKFIGELFKLSMLTARIMHDCVRKLLRDLENPEEEDVESLCRLLTTVGHLLDGSQSGSDPNNQKAAQVMKIYFDRLDTLRRNEKLSSRIRFMIQDLAELRQNGWQGRTESAGPKTIQEIHADAARQQAEESRRAMSGGRGLPPRVPDALARGGSRSGRERSGPDGWSTIAPMAPPARPSKAGDLKAFGQVRTSSSTGGAPTTFGPSGAFAIKGRASSKEAPSPLEAQRQNSFAALDNAEVVELDPSRPRLHLAPRTLPLEGEEGKEDAPPEDQTDGTTSEAPTLDEAAIRRSIDNSIKEFFELKDFDEAVLACQQLPDHAKTDFVAGLSLKVIDMREQAVNQLCELFGRFLDEEVLSDPEMGEGFKPLLKDLDDLGADAPLAFHHAAKLIRTTDLSEDDVIRLAEVMESIEGDDDEARQEVRDKLLREWRKQAPEDS